MLPARMNLRKCLTHCTAMRSTVCHRTNVKLRSSLYFCTETVKFDYAIFSCNATPHLSFHTSNRQLAHPLFLILLKLKGLKVIKPMAAVFGKTGRRIYTKLPENLQQTITKHKIVFSVILVVLLVIIYYSYQHYDICPITGRRRWISFTREQMLVLANMDQDRLLQTYKDKFLNENHILYKKCLALVDALIQKNDDLDIVKNVNWHLNIIHDDSINNAFVLPNGEIFLFSGMINLMFSWEELAIVLGHEMAHAILGHVQEQQSFAVFGELLFVPFLTFVWFLLDDIAAFVVYAIQHFLFPLIFEVGFTLPYSRQLEMEADVVGLRLAAKACFDPRWGVFLWDKFALKDALDELNDSENLKIEFLSSHPNSDTRAAMIEESLSDVLSLRLKCNCHEICTEVDPLYSAHIFRKLTVNTRSRIDVLKNIENTESKLNTKDLGQLEFNAITEKLQELKQQLNVLTSDFQLLVEKQNSLTTNHKESKAPEGKSILNFKSDTKNILLKAKRWSSIVGNFTNHNSYFFPTNCVVHGNSVTTDDRRYRRHQDYYSSHVF